MNSDRARFKKGDKVRITHSFKENDSFSGCYIVMDAKWSHPWWRYQLSNRANSVREDQLELDG